MGSYIVGVAGGSGSGKSTFVDGLKAVLGNNATVIGHDNYYRERSDLSYAERCLINYDEPKAFDNELFIEHLRLLKDGVAVDAPLYDYTIHNRKEVTTHIEPAKIILLDGIMLFEEPRVLELCDLKIFIDTDADTRILRRAMRDINERGRSLSSIVSQYLETVKPMYEKYVEPTKKHADIVLPNGGMNKNAIDMVANYLLDIVK